MKLAIELDSDVVTPGERVSGFVRVLEGGGSRSLTVTVRFCERSPAYLAAPFSDGAVIHTGDLATGHTIRFALGVPESALPGVKSKHGELFWELEAVSDQPGPDARAQRVFTVALPAGPGSPARAPG